MKISKVDVIQLDIPFEDGGTGEGMTPSAWNQFDTILVRIETDTGLVGWGEAFAYFCAGAVRAMLEDTVVPILIGLDAGDPEAISEMLQRRLCLFGRYGITIFALSGVDIALWDLKGKAEGRPVAELLGGRRRDSVPTYASLVRYGVGPIAAKFVARARQEGYDLIKLHEVEKEAIAACLPELEGAQLMVDVNCNWPEQRAAELAGWLRGLGNVLWLEEPTFPPEDFAQMGRIRGDLAVSAGENLCTSWQFADLIASGAVKYPQPSVTKVGGLSEMAKIMARAESVPGVELMPHSPYFGPGYLATLQVCAALSTQPLFEYLYVEPAAFLYPDMPLPKAGATSIPQGSGLGMDPDPAVIEAWRVA